MSASRPAYDRTAMLLLTFGHIAVGGSWVAARVAVTSISPLSVAIARFATAAILLWLWTKLQRIPTPRPDARALKAYAVMGLTAVAFHNALFLNGLRLAPASDGAVIGPGFTPVITAVFMQVAYKQPITRAMAAGFVTAIAGLVLVVNPMGAASTSTRLAGDLLFLLTAVCWMGYSLTVKRAGLGGSPVTATMYATMFGLLALVPMAVVENGWSTFASASPAAWAGIAYLATFSTVFSFVALYEGIRRIGPVRAGAFSYMVPVIGVVSSVILLGEELRALTVVGGALVLVGLWLVQRR
jgi:drug/metabolite transporter (DMT)-like permease